MAEHRDAGPERGDRIGGERRVVAVEAVEDRPGRPAQVGQGVDLVADPVESLEERVAEVPLPPQPVDDLVARAPAGDVGDEVAEQPVDARGRRPVRRPAASSAASSAVPSQPASRSRADSMARTLCPSAAASLSDSTRAEVAAGGRPERPSSSRIRPTWPIRIVASRDPDRSAATSRPAR